MIGTLSDLYVESIFRTEDIWKFPIVPPMSVQVGGVLQHTGLYSSYSSSGVAKILHALLGQGTH